MSLKAYLFRELIYVQVNKTMYFKHVDGILWIKSSTTSEEMHFIGMGLTPIAAKILLRDCKKRLIK